MAYANGLGMVIGGPGGFWAETGEARIMQITDKISFILTSEGRDIMCGPGHVDYDAGGCA